MAIIDLRGGLRASKTTFWLRRSLSDPGAMDGAALRALGRPSCPIEVKLLKLFRV